MDNWISSTILDILQRALIALQATEEPLEFHVSVPEAYKSQFLRGRKFSDHYKVFVGLCMALEAQERDAVIEALAGQNQFPELFEVNHQSPSIAETLPTIHQAARDLFESAFGKFSDLKTPGSDETVRGRYHQLVHAHIKSGRCPFCGLEVMDAPDPDLVDPDLDHYLAISKYPFAGANLRNHTAMGTTCNRSYKRGHDILLNELRQRVACIDPYGDEHVSVCQDGTVLLPGAGDGPVWALTFHPDAMSHNWRRVFKIDARLKLNVLEGHYQTWLKHLISYARKVDIDIGNRDGAIEAVKKFKATCEYETFPAIALLKMKFFELVELELNDPEGGVRMHNFIVELPAA